ncbi:MAG: flavin reductase family protein [Pseudonocardia sp.]|uniref:flavin reductase family protein n=1 Tax=unclassified Pseudonocardia TaxID=2619320 RepID=UPI00086D6456|nr:MULTISPECIES: flavin reductase family protein [unclassified Pseudonocardia]MBN9107143.1 flavin reductase family protein [Pseudonocardia sp.]ODU26372.1 MAG: flavin reductase [Pseudonocardia sp. SCN 72-51]ODV02707.1 MAG: flavin reductase [Pseudonocardia sp. SCN 73-27]
MNGQPNHATHTYRTAISRFTTGVAVVTTTTPDGDAGMTASAVTSLSLDPLQLIVCVGNTLRTRAAIVEAGRFAVNVLGAGNEDVALRFAGRHPDKFADIRLRTEHDVPVLEVAIAHFVCRLGAALPGGDHTILVGDVEACGFAEDADPLVYFGSSFGRLCDSERHAQLQYDWQLALAM